jgi:hypothetical protein
MGIPAMIGATMEAAGLAHSVGEIPAAYPQGKVPSKK